MCWDSCSFVSFIEGTEQRIANLRAVFEEAVQKEILLVASSLCITEVAFTAAERAGCLSDEIERNIEKLWLPGSPVIVVDYSRLIARKAQQLLRLKCEKHLGLKPMDAIHIATAMQQRATELHTYDTRLYKWGEHVGVAIKAPEPHQMLLHGPLPG